MDSTNYHVVESIHLPPNNEGELVPYSPSANVLHRGFKAIIHIIQICLISTRFENEQKKLSCFLLKKLRTMLKNNVCMIEIKSLCICLWLFDISTLHKKKKKMWINWKGQHHYLFIQSGPGYCTAAKTYTKT